MPSAILVIILMCTFIGEGHFTLHPLLEWKNDSNNVIGGEQKFICLGLCTKGQQMPPISLFASFGAKSVTGGRKFVHIIYGNPNSLQIDKVSIPNKDEVHHFSFLNP
jgi:hypothetical protein